MKGVAIYSAPGPTSYLCVRTLEGEGGVLWFLFSERTFVTPQWIFKVRSPGTALTHLSPAHWQHSYLFTDIYHKCPIAVTKVSLKIHKH